MTVIDKVRNYKVVQVHFLHQPPLLGKMLVAEKLLVGRHRRIDKADPHALRVFSEDHPHLRCRVVAERVVPRGVHDSRLIEMVQSLNHSRLETCRQRTDFGERHAQTRCLNRLNAVVIVVVRLESVQQRIALTLQCIIRLIDWEIVLGD